MAYSDQSIELGGDDMMTPVKRVLLVSAGCLSLALGVIGAFLPLLPTVPLVLLAGFCFARSSEKLHAWLLAHRYFGPIIENFEAGRGVPRRVKVRAITIIWLSMGFSSWIVGRPMLILMLVTIGLATSTYLWRLPEYQTNS